MHYQLHAEPIRITVGEWPPFIGEHLEDKGVGAKIVKEVFQNAGYEVIYEFYPWSRSYRYAAIAEREGTILWSYNEERAKIFHYSDPIMMSGSFFFMKKNRLIPWKSFRDLRGNVVGALSGYYYGPDFAKAEKNREIDVQRMTITDEKLLRLLLTRLDIVAVDYYVGHSILNQYFEAEDREQITHHPKPLSLEDLFLIMPKKGKYSQKYIDHFNVKLKEMKAKGDIESLLKKALGGAELPSPQS
ncbi:substrate-binding periplasmic protein [Algicola sagamiensis]|uniref:substrate-binding periplasmic protein n=1 Tax=Algicola sagamiensis TaxID=163869 RepID=UPI0003801289|nr:transporter substrate-binding domain-containing protein [Algicola sagamiensis]